MFSRSKLVRFMFMLCMTAASCLAQVSTATITGVVQDSAGALVPGAQVVVTQTQTNSTAQTVTDASGVFSLPALAVGPYSMSVTATGFASYARTNIVLTVGQVANFEVQLRQAVWISCQTLPGPSASTTAPIPGAQAPASRETLILIRAIPTSVGDCATLINHTIGAAHSFGTPRHFLTAERLSVHCSAHGSAAATSFSIQVSPTVSLPVLLTTRSPGQTSIALTTCLVSLSG
jgi:hypothetical protein